MRDILELDLYIGLTGLSFRTEENLEVIKQIPIDKIVIATDAPFCMTKQDFAGA
jgi:TatD DNase family protein